MIQNQGVYHSSSILWRSILFVVFLLFTAAYFIFSSISNPVLIENDILIESPVVADVAISSIAPTVPSSPNGRRSLLVLALGAPHELTIAPILRRFLSPPPDDEEQDDSTFDIWIYPYDSNEWSLLKHPEFNQHPHLRVFWEAPKALMKPEFATKYLDPEAVRPYEFIFLWDGDGILPNTKWNPRTYVRTAREAQLDISQPVLDFGSQHSHEFNTRKAMPRQALFQPTLYVELGFMVFEQGTWQRIWTHVLQKFPFKFWCFDALPFQCLPQVAARNVGIINLPIFHPHGKHLLKIRGGGPDPAVRAHIDKEIEFARQLVTCSDCCHRLKSQLSFDNHNGCFPMDYQCPQRDISYCQLIHLIE